MVRTANIHKMTFATRTVHTLALSLISIAAAMAQGNDNCAQAPAQNLAIGSSLTLTGNNSTATATNDFVVGSPYAGSPVYWVKFTTTACANVTISYCGQSPAWVGTFDVLASTCPGDVLVHASTANTVDCGDGNTTYLYNLLPAGTWAFAVLNNPGAQMSGPFSLTVSATACAENNDQCNQLIPQALASGSSLTFSADNTSASGVNDFAAGSPYFGTPVYWHAFSLSGCNNVTVNYCAQVPAWTNTLGIISRDCPGNDLINASAFNTTECGNSNSTFRYDFLTAGTYYIPVLADGGSGSLGAYTLNVSAQACVENNDDCSQVVPQPLASGGSLTFTGDNTNASGLNDFDASSPYFGSPVYWHAFTTTGCNDVVVDYCGQSPVWTNTFGILARDCPGLDLVSASQFNNSNCVDGNITFYYTALAEGTYYVPVLADGGSGSIGPYTIHASATACPVNNDLCTSTPNLALSAGSPLVITANNAGAGSAGDWVPGSLFDGTPVNWHRFTTTQCLDVDITYCGTTPPFGQTLGLVASDCPGSLLTFASNGPACPDGNTAWAYEDLPAGTWYIPVINNPGQNASGPYTLNISGAQCDIGIDEPGRLITALFPNPSDGSVNLLSSVSGPARITLLDVTGRTVSSERVNLSAGQITDLDLTRNVPGGNYALRVDHSSGTDILRLQVR